MTPYMIEQELRPGEKLYWKGKPKQGIFLRASDAFVIPFSLVWGFGMLSGFTQNSHNAPPPTFLTPFALIALYLIFGRFIVDALMRRRTQYAVTSEQAIIVSGFSTRKVHSINLKTISDISVSEKTNGSGNIVFGAANSYTRGYRGFYLSGMPIGPLAFDTIEHVRDVDALIKKAQKSDA